MVALSSTTFRIGLFPKLRKNYITIYRFYHVIMVLTIAALGDGECYPSLLEESFIMLSSARVSAYTILIFQWLFHNFLIIMFFMFVVLLEICLQFIFAYQLTFDRFKFHYFISKELESFLPGVQKLWTAAQRQCGTEIKIILLV